MKKFRFSIRLTVVSMFIFATLLTAAVAIGLQYHFSRQMAVDAALSQYRLTAAGTRDYLAAIDSKASQSAGRYFVRGESVLKSHVGNGWQRYRLLSVSFTLIHSR